MESNFDKTIKSLSFDQHEILYNIMQLHNNGEPFECDITYSKGAFYGDFTITDLKGNKKDITIPKPKYCCDVVPQQEDTIKIEPLGKLPFEDESIKSIVFDPPFVISIGPSLNGPAIDENGNKNNIIARRFASYYPVNQLLDSYYHWMEEFNRVLKPNGIIVVKTQQTITGSKSLNSPNYLWFLGNCLGLDTIDTFVLGSKARLISGKVKKQGHARRFECEFQVFKKSRKLKIPYLDFASDELIEKLMNDFVKYNLSKKRLKVKS